MIAPALTWSPSAYETCAMVPAFWKPSETLLKGVVLPVTETWAKSTPDGEKVLAAFRAENAKLKAGQ